MRGDWIQTYSGRQFWPMDPHAADVEIEDIAHSLSMLCRYAGHCLRFYSVAEHCCHLHDHAAAEDRAWALLHDASEAYLVDVPRPVKPFLEGYKAAENAVMSAVASRFGLPMQEPPAVKVLDGRILSDEMQQNMAAPPAEWTFYGEPLGVVLQYWTPEQAKAQFMARFGALNGIRTA